MAQYLKTNRSDNRGGKRERSGRPKTDTKPYGKRVTELERIALDSLLEKMRSKFEIPTEAIG